MSDEELMVEEELENVDLADVLRDRMAELKATEGDEEQEQPPDIEEAPPENEPQQEVVSPPPPLLRWSR